MRKSEKYTIRQISVWLWQASLGARSRIILCTLIGIISVICSLIFVLLSKNIIDIATGIRPGKLIHYGIGMAILMLIETLLHAADNWIVNILGTNNQNRLRSRLFERLMQCEWQGREQHHSGDILNRLVQDLNTVVSTITSTISFLIITLVQFVASFCLLFSMDRMLAVMLMLILPIFALLSRIYVRRMRHMNKAVRESDSRIHAIVQESLQHKTVVKTLEQGQGMTQRLKAMHDRLYDEVVTRTRFTVLSRSLVSAGFSFGYLTALLWGVFRIQSGAITFGVMTAFLQLVGRIQRPLADLSRLIPTLVSSITSAERLMELEELPLEESGSPIRMNGTAGIRIDNVSFNYSKNGRTIIRDLNADFPPGSMTAILGETGAGKTTLIRLILSLIHPSKGKIIIYDNEQEIEVSPRTRTNLVYVPQGNTLFSGTIRENLLLGRPDASDKELWEVLDTACADFVKRLPEGLDTPCSEQGGGLSEGQAQRIAIARSLLRSGTILLLDEATSALDPETERHLLHNIATTQQGKTLIFITHRPSVLEYCDRVLKVNREDSQKQKL